MQKVKGVKVTRKVKIVKQKFCIKKTHTFTIIAMNYAQEQLKTKCQKDWKKNRTFCKNAEIRDHKMLKPFYYQ